MILLDDPRAIDGSLEFGGVPGSELARSYETPLFIIDTDVFDAKIAKFARVGNELGIDVAYAGKALLITALARRLREANLSLDVCSLGELLTAEAAGYPPERLYMHGCGKTTAELTAIAAGRVGRVVVDGFDELYRLASLARVDRPVSVILRLNTGIEAHTHEFVRTGGDGTKFGFATASLEQAADYIRSEPGLRLLGLHSHIGSQIMDAEPFLANSAELLTRYFALRDSGHDTIADLIIGGGFSVPMHPEETAADFDVATLLRTVVAQMHASFVERTNRGLAAQPLPTIGIEPGRALIAEAGSTLYRVLAVKQQGENRYVIVDGGMTDNPRPALYGSYHHPVLASRISQAVAVPMILCGRTCENDRLVETHLPEDIRAGDLIGMRTTGAYTYSMASNYNRFTRPAVVFCGNGEHALAARRETESDVLRLDI